VPGNLVAVEEDFVGAPDALAVVDAEGGGGVALRIDVDEEGGEATLGKGGGEVDRCGGLADPTLLVGHCEHARPSGGREGFT